MIFQTNALRGGIALGIPNKPLNRFPTQNLIFVNINYVGSITAHLAFEALLRQLTPQIHRYQPWTRMAADSADLHQELRVTLWFALQTHPPQILQQIFGLGGETHDF